MFLLAVLCFFSSSVSFLMAPCIFACVTPVFLQIWGHIRNWVHWKKTPSGQTATCRKTEVIQSHLRIWGTYDPIESCPSKPKKMGITSEALMSNFWLRRTSGRLPEPIFGPKFCIFHATPIKPTWNGVNIKILPTGCPVIIVTKRLDHFRKK